MTVGQKIQKMRADAGLSQTQLAEALTVSRSAVAKWENDNGMPDVDNLKLLADYFHIDVDRLLDQSWEPEPPKSPQAIKPRPDTYCGKSCDHCGHKEALDCSGCKMGLGKRFAEKCDIAKCGRGRNIFQCERCTDYYVCSTVRRKEKIPEILLDKRKQEEERILRIKHLAPIGAKWFLVMFWLAVALEVFGIFASEIFSGWQVVSYSAQLIKSIIYIVYGCILLRFSKFENRFSTAGILTIVTPLIGLIIWYLGEMEPLNNWVLIFALVGTVLSLIASYKEYTACANLVYEVSKVTSHSWLVLRKLYFGAMIGCIVSIILVKIFPLIGLVALLGCTVLVLISGVVRIVNLRHSMLAFRYYV